MPLTVLIIDDDQQYLEFVRSVLQGNDVEVFTALSGEEGWELFTRTRPQAVLLDLVLPDVSGMDLLQRMVGHDAGVEVILMTGHYSTESAVDAIQKGASDYLTKPVEVTKLRERIARVLADRKRRQVASRLDESLLETFSFQGIIGRSPAMLQVFDRMRRIAPHFQTVLVTGPTGSGKELVARALHRLSRRAGALVVGNCSAIAESLAETELFGHVRGAFTGATSDRAGLFEHAQGGTLFLDEIGELSLASQAKLLRVLQQREVQRVGSPIMKSVDVRVVAATNRNLRQMVAAGRFREDLFFRLMMLEIAIPSLSERKEDLPLLEHHFLCQFNQTLNRNVRGITLRARQLLARYEWRGNVRELENTIGQACMLTESDMIDVHDLPEYVRDPLRNAVVDDEQMLSMDALQRRHAKRVLRRVGGNKLRAAEVLGISRTHLYALLSGETGSRS